MSGSERFALVVYKSIIYVGVASGPADPVAADIGLGHVVGNPHSPRLPDMLKTFFDRAGYALFVLFSSAIGSHAFRYLYAEVSAASAFHHSFAEAGWWVPLHFFFAGLALLLAPLALSARLRRAWPAAHRMVGWLYTLAVGTAAVAGGVLAFRAQTGWAAGSSFLLLAIAWFAITATAVTQAVRRRFDAHRRWMLRSVALTFAAVTLRLYLGAGLALAHWSFATAYIVAAWACWTLNLLAVEVYLRARPVVLGLAPPTRSSAIPG